MPNSIPKKTATKKQSIKSKFKLPFMFWVSMMSFAVFIFAVAFYVISQNESRIMQAAKISASGLASFVSDYVEKHQLIVKSIAYHHQDRVLALSKGAGYPYDLAEIENDIKELFPADTEFAIIDQKGRIVVGSHVDRMGPKCQSLIKESIYTGRPTLSKVKAHQAPNGEFHFDILFPLSVGDDWAGLWVKLSFTPLERFIVNLNIQEYELVISEQFAPFNILLGDHPKKLSWKSEFSAFFDEFELQALDHELQEKALAVEPIENVSWQVRAIQREEVFNEYVYKVILVSLLIFGVVFIVVVLIYLFFRQLHNERERMKQVAVHDELFNAGPTVLLEKKIDLEMSILYASPNVESLLGKDAKSLLDKSFIAWIHPEDVHEVKEKLLNAYLANQDKVEMVYRLKVKSDYKWIYDLSHILYNQAGKPELLRGYITSIHAQKTAEKNATDLIQSVPEAIFVINYQGRILNANTAAQKLLKCTKEDLNKKLFSLWLESDSFALYERLKRDYLNQQSSLEKPPRETLPLYLRDTLGNQISVEIGFNQIEINGEILLVQVVRDITLQQQTQQQLSLAKERAEALAKARSRFVATISHEIRTPMNGVLGMTDLLFDTDLDATQTQYLQAIKLSGDVLLKIINEVLDFAKLDEGQVLLVNEPFNLPNLVEETLHLLSTIAEEKSVDLKYEYEANVPHEFVGDVMRIQQILLNLIGNALKFTEQGEVSVKVSQTKEPFSGHVLIEVMDTGIGIAAENIDKLFDSFTQADGSTSRQFGGTGLGLAICKQLVDLMEGEIGVVSEPNKGSCFWITLPLKGLSKVNIIHSSSVKPLPVAKKDATSNSLPLSGKTVLLVEDNQINQNVITAFLKRLGAEVDLADNGLKGLDIWRVNPRRYHLIVMDCQMPVMDGFEATRMIRKEETLVDNYARVPILALTANVMVQDKQRCIQVGMDDFLAKPIEKQTFNDMVTKWCL